jgi:hypothetical protein
MFLRASFIVVLTKTAPGEISEVPLLVSWFYCNRAPPRHTYIAFATKIPSVAMIARFGKN